MITVVKELIHDIEVGTLTNCAEERSVELCQEQVHEWHSICVCGIGEFRLQILIQLLVLSGLIQSNLSIVDRIYPIPGQWSYIHLESCGVDPAEMFDCMTILGYKLGISRMSYLENLLRETQPDQEEMKDIFFKHQTFYKVNLSETGKYMVQEKPYGE